jgi:hypothetical protein
VSCQYDRYIVLDTREGFDPALAAEVRKDLAAELGPRGFGVCTARVPDGELVAEVWLGMPEATLVSIQVDDLLTGKRVSRDVPLARIPVGGTALAIAIAADELLRASWAELSLPRRDEDEEQPQKRAEATPGLQSGPRTGLERGASHRVVNARASPGSERAALRPARALSLGLVLGYTRSPRSWNALGLELRGGARAFGWGWAEAGFGGFGALEVDGAAGSVRARGVSASVSLGACAPDIGRLSMCGGARGGLQWIQFRGLRPASGRGFERDLASFVLSAVGQLGVHMSRRFVALFELALGGAPLGARADDGVRTLMGVDGFVFSTGAGLGFRP